VSQVLEQLQRHRRSTFSRVGIYDIYFQPQGKYLAYTRDANGNGLFNSTFMRSARVIQLCFRWEVEKHRTSVVQRWRQNSLQFESCRCRRRKPSLLNPLDPKTDRLLESLPVAILKLTTGRQDDKNGGVLRFHSNTASSHGWLM